MGMLSKFRRKRRFDALSEEERIGRYVYLLNTLPASVIERAHAAAFKDLPADQRREMFEQLRPFLSDAEQGAASDDPTVLAKLVRRAEERRAQRVQHAREAAESGVQDPRDAVDPRALLTSAGVAGVVSQHVVLSAAVVTYFAGGGGSMAMESGPVWIGDTYDPGASASFGGGGYDGGAFDGGGFGGGFDGGGFGGGDGGGG